MEAERDWQQLATESGNPIGAQDSSGIRTSATRCRLTNHWSRCVKDDVPSSNIGVRPLSSADRAHK